MEEDSRANAVTVLKQILTADDNNQFDGIACDQESSMLFVCTNNAVVAYSSTKLDEPKKIQEITVQTPMGGPVSPYKVAIYLDIRGGSKVLMAVADRNNSTLTQVQLKYSKATMGFGKTKSMQSQVISTLSVKGSKKGSLNKPQGIAFDPAGNLWVADDRNERLQLYPFARDGSTALDNADDDIAVNVSLLSTMKSVAVVTDDNDKPIILVGFCAIMGESPFGAKKVMCLAYE